MKNLGRPLSRETLDQISSGIFPATCFPVQFPAVMKTYGGIPERSVALQGRQSQLPRRNRRVGGAPSSVQYIRQPLLAPDSSRRPSWLKARHVMRSS